MCSLTFYFERLGKGFDHGAMGKGVRKDFPTRSPVVRATMRGIRIENCSPKVRAAPLMLDTLEKIIDLQPDTLKGVRNRALLSVTWSAALRSDEAARLNVTPGSRGNGMVEFTPDGIVVVLKRSKTNRSGTNWERYGIPSRKSVPKYCPRVLLREWLDASGLQQGPLFPSIRGFKGISSTRITRRGFLGVIRRGVAELGLPPERYGTRSLRSGCITWLIHEGVHPARVMEHSGHSTLSIMLSYVRSVTAVASSPLAETRWCR